MWKLFLRISKNLVWAEAKAREEPHIKWDPFVEDKDVDEGTSAKWYLYLSSCRDERKPSSSHLNLQSLSVVYGKNACLRTKWTWHLPRERVIVHLNARCSSGILSTQIMSDLSFLCAGDLRQAMSLVPFSVLNMWKALPGSTILLNLIYQVILTLHHITL